MDKLYNNGLLTAGRTLDSDEVYTPFYAVEPIVKYVPKNMKVWCPFDKEYSAYYQTFTAGGYYTIKSHIDDGQDFFEYEPEQYDIIISNPPYSKKDEVLKRLYELNKPFAILIPLNSLQGKKRCELFVNGIQILSFNQRIGFHNITSMDATIESSPFATAYFCRNLLPSDLIIEKLHKYNKSLRG